MGQSAEDQIRAIQRDVIGRDERDVAPGDTDSGAALVIRRGESQREAWVRENECAELAAGVSAGPEHTDRNLIHP
jgi:predicted Ser/Thr protein kinase